jgi:hypothetical protein
VKKKKMETKNVVIAMLCASIAILSVATPISAVSLTDSGIEGGILGDGSVTGEVVVSARGNPDGTGAVEASMEATAELNGPGAAVCIADAHLTSTLTTELGTIEATSDGGVVAAVEVEEEGLASADASLGTEASLGASEVVIESEISSGTDVETNGGSASATAIASGTTSGEGTSYATDGAPSDAYSYAEVSGTTVANAAVNDTAGAGSYAVVKSTDYAGHNAVRETSNIGAGSYGWSDDGNASANSNAEGVAYQFGQAETCAYSETYAEGMVGTAVMTAGPDSAARSNANIGSYDYAYARTDEDGTKYGSVSESSNIGASSYASSVTDGEALAISGADGYTYAYGSACDCVYSDTEAEGMVGTAVMTAGPAYAGSNANIGSYDYAYARTDEDGTKSGSVSESSKIGASSYASSETDGAALAISGADGYTWAYGSACDCVYSDTYADGIVGTEAWTMGPAYAWKAANIGSYDYAYAYTDEDGNKEAGVRESSQIEVQGGIDSDGGLASGIANADGYTWASGSACDCVYSGTYATGKVSAIQAVSGEGSTWDNAYIMSYESAYSGTDGAYVSESSDIYSYAQSESGKDGEAVASSGADGSTWAYGGACGCVYSGTYADGMVNTAAMTAGLAYADSFSHIWSTDEASVTDDGAEVAEQSSIYVGSYAESKHRGEAVAISAAEGYTDAYGGACGCLYSDTDAEGTVDATAWSADNAWISTYARLTSDGRIVIGKDMAANSVIVTGATAMHNSNSAGEANAEGFTGAYAENWCTGEWVSTGIEDGVGVTIVNPFNVMGTGTYAGFAYAYANPIGFEEVNQTIDIDTSGLTNVAYSWTEAIATTP